MLTLVRDELLGRSSADFFLVHDLDTSNVISPVVTTARQRQLLEEIADWTATLMNSGEASFNDSSLRITYLTQAKQRGWLALDGSLRLKSLQDAFLKNCAELASFPAFQFVADADGVNGGFLGSLTRQHPGRRHPSKHIVLTNFLFAEPEEFFRTYAIVEAAIAQDGAEGAKKLLTNVSRQLISLIEQSGQPVCRVAKELNLTAGEALSHLNRRTDVKRSRRPHIVGTPREAQLREMLNNGRSRSEIAKTLSVRPSFIKDYLAPRPELKAQWNKENTTRETKKHRAQLLAALNANPGLPIKAIRRLPQNGFQWLYNNDKDWLLEILPAIWKR